MQHRRNKTTSRTVLPLVFSMDKTWSEIAPLLT